MPGARGGRSVVAQLAAGPAARRCRPPRRWCRARPRPPLVADADHARRAQRLGDERRVGLRRRRWNLAPSRHPRLVRVAGHHGDSPPAGARVRSRETPTGSLCPMSRAPHVLRRDARLPQEPGRLRQAGRHLPRRRAWPRPTPPRRPTSSSSTPARSSRRPARSRSTPCCARRPQGRRRRARRHRLHGRALRRRAGRGAARGRRGRRLRRARHPRPQAGRAAAARASTC